MGFLAPALLGLGALAAVPLLVHLLRRRVGRTVDFPAVRYLARMEREHSRELKLRHRLLLILRILAVIVIALAAARPFAQLAGVGHSPVAVAIVLDNSMSSGAVSDGQSSLDGLREEARSLLESLSPDDRAWIITADGRVFGGPAAELRGAVDELKALGGRGDLAASVRRAVALSRGGAPRTPVVALLSDGQANAFGASTDSVVDVGNVPVIALLKPRQIRNRAVIIATANPLRWTPTGSVDFAVASPDSASWRITLDGRTVARGAVAPGTINDPALISHKLSSSAVGWMRGSVEIDADELRGDDVRWFALRVAPAAAVAARAESGPFVVAALSTLIEEDRLAKGVEGVAGTVTVSGADAVGLESPLLLTAPADPVRVGEANRTLTRLGIPWRFGAISRDLVLTRASAGSTSPLDDVPVRLRYPLVYSPGTATGSLVDTLATAGGTPWAVSGEGYVLIASPFEPDATDFPLRATFVPWLLDVLSRQLGEDGRLVRAHPGESLIGFSRISALERPDGSLVSLNSDRLVAPDLPGVYFLRRQAFRVGALVVNPEPEESNLAPFDSAQSNRAFTSRFSGKNIARQSDGSSWREVVLNQGTGRSLLPWLVALALVALSLESWLSRERLGSRDQSPSSLAEPAGRQPPTRAA